MRRASSPSLMLFVLFGLQLLLSHFFCAFFFVLGF
jgi:hypothetical protein